MGEGLIKRVEVRVLSKSGSYKEVLSPMCLGEISEANAGPAKCLHYHGP